MQGNICTTCTRGTNEDAVMDDILRTPLPLRVNDNQREPAGSTAAREPAGATSPLVKIVTDIRRFREPRWDARPG